MDRATELALVSTYVYSRDSINRVGIPPGWTLAQLDGGQSAYLTDTQLGLSAGAFLDASGNIVISFTGTNEAVDWLTGNFPSAAGLQSPQILQAIRFVSDVLAQYEGQDKQVTFTGHSLGGGLASVMAVFFDCEAHVFDSAPFQLSAANSLTVLSYFTSYALYQTLRDRSIDLSFTSYAANPFLFSAREANVVATAMSGEILTILRTAGTSIESSMSLMDVTSSSLYQTATSVSAAELLAHLPLSVALATPQMIAAAQAATELHSIDMLTLMLDSEAFRQAVQQSPRLMQLMFSNALYGPAPSSSQQDFVARLVQHHFGVSSGLIGADPVSASAMADRFGADILALGTINTFSSSRIADGVIATLIEAYQFSSTSPINGYVQTTATAARIDFSALATPANPIARRLLIDAVAEQAGPADSARVSVAAGAAVQ